jgi:hypothetical protein
MYTGVVVQQKQVVSFDIAVGGVHIGDVYFPFFDRLVRQTVFDAGRFLRQAVCPLQSGPSVVAFEEFVAEC